MTRRRLLTVVVTVSAGLVLLISSASFAADKPSPTISISLEPSSRPEVAAVGHGRLVGSSGVLDSVGPPGIAVCSARRIADRLEWCCPPPVHSSQGQVRRAGDV